MTLNSLRAFYLTICLVLHVIVICQTQTTVDDEYKYGTFTSRRLPEQKRLLEAQVVNQADYEGQVLQIQLSGSPIFTKYLKNFEAVDKWIHSGGKLNDLHQYADALQMRGYDNKSHFLLTGYYTVELQVRTKMDGEFRFPIYRFPPKIATTEAQVTYYKTHEEPMIGFCNSIFDINMIKRQNIGYVNYGDKGPSDLLRYVKPGDYSQSIFENYSTEAYTRYTRKRTNLRMPYKINDSYAVLRPLPYINFRGSCGIPLIDKASAAADLKIAPGGTILLVEVPRIGIMDEDRRFRFRLVVVLDEGIPPIDGFQLDLYHGKGVKKVRDLAIKYWHMVRVWELVSRQV